VSARSDIVGSPMEIRERLGLALLATCGSPVRGINRRRLDEPALPVWIKVVIAAISVGAGYLLNLVSPDRFGIGLGSRRSTGILKNARSTIAGPSSIGRNP
jgi:hypothetical protein